jgi:hypothetical protein
MLHQQGHACKKAYPFFSFLGTHNDTLTTDKSLFYLQNSGVIILGQSDQETGNKDSDTYADD